MAAAGACLFVTLPPSQIALAPLAPPPTTPTVAGVSHVHSSRSDGTGTPDEIAAAAARAGLGFVILTDHGDGTATPEPPRYLSGVLTLDGVEISTAGGHYIAVGLGRTPYPLGGEALDVIEDVARLGGFGIAAHPDSARADLRWRGGTADFDAMEWLNGDSQWRDEPPARLLAAAVTYPFRPVATLTSLLDRPSTTLQQWDGLTRQRPLVGLAGSDAHARLGLRGEAGDPDGGRTLLRAPSYETLFSVLSLRVELDRSFSGEAATDAGLLMEGLAGGRVYTVVDGIAAPAQFDLLVSSGAHDARQGQALHAEGPVTVEVRSNAPPGSVTTLFRDGQAIATVEGSELRQEVAPGPAVLRAEVRIGDDASDVPWIVSNPVYVSQPPPRELPPPPAATAEIRLDVAGAERRWHIEHSPGSEGTIERAEEGPVTVRYALAADDVSPFVALVAPAIAALGDTVRIAFRASADRPMRLSVQVRAADADQGQRWRRSIYLDPTPRDIAVAVGDMTPAGPTDTPTPNLSELDDLILTVDTVNTAPGSSGSFAIDNLRLEW